MRKINSKPIPELELLNFFKTYTRTKKYCLLLRDPIYFAALRNSLNRNYNLVAKLAYKPQLAQGGYGFLIRQYSLRVEADLMKYQCMG
jgi:hypothetical protein